MPDQSRRPWHRLQHRLPHVLSRVLFSALLVFGLASCDMIQNELGLEDPAVKAAKTDGEGRAVGGACRQSGRAIEDCYAIYAWLPKAPIYEGWRDMDAYMRDNKLETIVPQLPPVAAPGTRRATPVVVPPTAPMPATAPTEAAPAS